MRTCTIDGCERPHCARGWCQRHWQRWRRTGDPEGSIPRVRRDAWRHGTRYAYEKMGCRCLPCAVAKSKTYRNPTGMGDARALRRHVRALMESGWKRQEIAAEAGIARQTVDNILARRVRSVLNRTADALLALEPMRGPVYLDSGPLLDVIDRRQFTINRMSDTDRAAVLRARKKGFLRDDVADRLCVHYLRLTLEEVWGPDWDRVAA